MEAAVVVTYRCNSRCRMCSTWQFPTSPEEEFKPALLEKLPRLSFSNVTGGEPFLRADLEEIIAVLEKKAKRIVISTNGSLTDRILELARAHKNVGVRVSLEGLAAANDELRGVEGGFERGLKTLMELRRLGLKDLGFGITVSDRNAKDMLELYALAKELKMEFATAAVHNSYYFHKHDNVIADKEGVGRAFEELTSELLRTPRVKNWYRAYFNHGLSGYVQGHPRLLPCPAGEDIFFLDPWGEVRPCNGMQGKYWCESFGNLHDQTFEEVWNSTQAELVRTMVRDCPKNCWMVGTAGPAMKKHIFKVTAWVAREKGRRLFRLPR
jgi:radical SAM protein with 4Fe4S-binding SPASM domain